MARGRLGSEFATAKRRAASVPADLLGPAPTLSTFTRAKDISLAAMDDSDAVRAASKRQDQRLLDNITHTLTSGVFHSPHLVVPSSNRDHLHHHRRASVSSASRNRFAHKRPVIDDEINYDMALPETARAFKLARRRAARATSVPPIPTYASSLPPERREFIYSAHLPTNKGIPRHYGIASDSPLFVQVSDSSPSIKALRREAPYYVARAYEFKPPKRPSRSSSSWRATSEPPPLYLASHLGASHRPRGLGHQTSLAVRQARQCLGRIERELGKGQNGPGYDFYSPSNDPYYGAIETPLASPVFVPTRVTRAGSSRAMSAPPRRYSVSGPPSSYASPSYSTQGSRIAEIEARLASQTDNYVEPMSFTALRSRTTDARNKMDQHKVMMDRYLPIYMGPPNEVDYEVAYKYSELAERMPSLEPYRPNPDRYNQTPVTPYKPITKAARGVSEYASKPPSGRSFRPHVSDTRKRCREVLCKTKGDPRYFD